MESGADIVGLQEVNERWMANLRELETRYPYRVIQTQEDNFGIALLSRFPIDDVEVRNLGHEGLPFIVAHVTLHGRRIALVLAHTVPPAGGGHVMLRNRQLDQLAGVRDEFSQEEFVLMGDLNTSPWSLAYQRLIEGTGLRNAARGFGYRPTWPTQMPWLMIPIDHCLVSPGLEVLDHQVGTAMGSDHLPITVELGLAMDSASP